MTCPLCKNKVAPWWKTVHHPGCPDTKDPADGVYGPVPLSALAMYNPRTGWVPVRGVA